MSRYNNIISKTSDSGKKVTKPVIYPSIPKSDQDIYVRTVVGDRLDVLAQTYYGDVNSWWIIATANNIGKGTLSIPAGTLLRIPKNISQIDTDYTNLNNY